MCLKEQNRSCAQLATALGDTHFSCWQGKDMHAELDKFDFQNAKTVTPILTNVLRQLLINDVPVTDEMLQIDFKTGQPME